MNATQTPAYEVTSTKPGGPVLVIAEFPSKWHATEFATKWMTTRAARGCVVTIRPWTRLRTGLGHPMTTQIRPRLSEALAAAVQAYADSLSRETGIPVSRDAAVNFLLRRALKDRGITIEGDGTDENST